MRHTIHDITLRHGARFLAIDVPNAIGASFSVAARAGYRYAPKQKYEMSHLLEHLAFSGNKKFPDTESFMYAIERTGAQQNANTSSTIVRYYFGAPREELANVVKMMMPMISQPLFKSSSIRQEIEVVKAELSRKLENDSFQTGIRNIITALPDYLPYEDRLKTLDNINRTDIVNYHQATHGAANLSFVIATDFSSGLLAEIEKLLNQELTATREGKLLAMPKRKWGDFAGKINILSPRAKNQNYFGLSFFTSADAVKDAPFLRIFHGVYNRGFGARLFLRSRQKGLSYGSSTGYSIEKDMIEFYIDDKTTPDKFLPLFEICLAELADLMEGNITEREFERARGYNVGSYELGFQLPSNFANWYGQDYAEGLHLESPAEYLDRLRAVKKSELAKVARKYIRPDNWVLTLCGNDLEDQKEKFEAAIKKYIG